MCEFKPISCCNIIYKCISKILTDMLKKTLPGIISNSQSAFVAERRIIDNILLVNELVKDYNKQRGRPWCAIKVDIVKTFDTVNWSFVVNILRAVPRDHFLRTLHLFNRCLHMIFVCGCALPSKAKIPASEGS